MYTNIEAQTGRQDQLGFVDPATLTTIASVGSSLWGAFSSDWPKPIPPPMPWSVDQVAEMLENSPSVRTGVQELILRQGHTHLRIGRQPSRAELERDVELTADLAVWFGNGTGDDLSKGEAQIRQLVETGMRQWESRQEELAIQEAQRRDQGFQVADALPEGSGRTLMWAALGIGGALLAGRFLG